MYRTILLCAFFVVGLAINHTHSEYQPAWNESWTDKLRRDLLTNYDCMVRPQQHNYTWVRIGFEPRYTEMNDMENEMEVYGKMCIVWGDDKLKWNSSEYGGIDSLQLGAHEIWLPDIHLVNRGSRGIKYYGNQFYFVQSDGLASMVGLALIHSYCHLDFTFWPFESNTCRLSFRSWNYDATKVEFKAFGHWITPKNIGYFPLTEWILKNITSISRKEIFDGSPEPYSVVDYVYEITHSSRLYCHTIFIPIIPIIIISLITFWMQPQSELKLLLNASVIFIIALQLIYFGYKVPPRSDSTPIIVKFYSACLYQAIISMFIAVLTINTKNFTYIMALPRPIKLILLGKPGRYLGLSHLIQKIKLAKSKDDKSGEEACENQQNNISLSSFFVGADGRHQNLSSSTSTKSILDLEWILLATAVSRLVFLLFCFVYIFLMISYVRITIDIEQPRAWVI